MPESYLPSERHGEFTGTSGWSWVQVLQAASEIQKRIRETIKGCKNAVHIKDDIVVHGSKDTHDKHLKVVLDTLQKKGITLRPDKCKIKQTEVKWFGHIFSKAGMSRILKIAKL